jgi:hypothetical protein
LVTFNVKVSNFPAFSGWDVYVYANDSILTPVSITLGNFFSSVFNVSNCVNATGLGCTGFDGLGIAHSGVASLGGDATGNGILFSITYIVGSRAGTPVTPFFDLVFSQIGAPISHLTRSSSFGKVGPADFTISVGPFIPPLKGFFIITLRAVNGFNGTIDLSATASGGLTPIISPPTVNLGPINTADRATMSIFANPGTYTVSVTGTSGTIIHTVILTMSF